MRKYALGMVGLALALVLPSSAVAQGTGDVLNEAPLIPIPQDMTYEEYQDMNRRISTGLMRSAIPVPGMMHFYAGEPTTGKWLLATGLAGVDFDDRWGGTLGRGRISRRRILMSW